MAALASSLLFLLGLVSTVSSYLDVYPPIDESDARTPLHFALLQSFGSEFNGSGSVAGLRVALDRINSDPTLLPGYSLHYTLTDSQVMSTFSIFLIFIQSLYRPSFFQDKCRSVKHVRSCNYLKVYIVAIPSQTPMLQRIVRVVHKPSQHPVFFF